VRRGPVTPTVGGGVTGRGRLLRQRWLTVVVRHARASTLLPLAVVASVAAAGCAADDERDLAQAAATSDPSPATTTAAPPTSTSTTTSTTSTSTTSTSTSTTSTSTTSTTSTSTSTTSTTTVPPPPSTDADSPFLPCRRPNGTWTDRPASDLAVPEPSEAWSATVVGSTRRGRDLVALVRSDAAAERTVLVIGGIHGNEPIAPPLVGGLVDVEPPPGVEVWLVPNANPDGSSRGARCNADGVDLNRNWAWDWDPVDGGPAPMSEPETRALASLIQDLRPDVVVWVHSSLGYVSSIGATPAAYAEAWARGAGLPARSDITQHGGSESWTALVAGIPSVLVEVDGEDVNAGIVAAHRTGFELLLAEIAPPTR
jgi:protein MpaA